MRILVIFRGHNVRYATYERTYVDILKCWLNLKISVIEDLRNNLHTVDTAFLTYNSDIIDSIKQIIQPTYIELFPCISQKENFREVLKFIKMNEHTYDRFIVLRCDMVYKNYITKWPKWDHKGIILIGKDVHWPTKKLYNDIVFIIDNSAIDILLSLGDSIYYGENMHALGRALETNNIDFEIMYDGYYHTTDHPIIGIASINEIPIFDKPYVDNAKSLDDISKWNY